MIIFNKDKIISRWMVMLYLLFSRSNITIYALILNRTELQLKQVASLCLSMPSKFYGRYHNIVDVSVSNITHYKIIYLTIHSSVYSFYSQSDFTRGRCS